MCSAYKLTHVLAPNLANRCTDLEGFYGRLEELKSNSKNKSSPVDIYFDDLFYQKAYEWLKAKAQNEGNSIVIDQKDKCWIIEKQWKVTAEDGKILDKQHRCVVPKKRNFHSTGKLPFSNSSPRKRQDSTQVVKLFILMCTLHHY